jgi:hypothetical protein
MHTKFWSEYLKETTQTHIKMTEYHKVGECGLDSSGSEYGPVVGSCEQSNKPLGFIKDPLLEKKEIFHNLCHFQ